MYIYIYIYISSHFLCEAKQWFHVSRMCKNMQQPFYCRQETRFGKVSVRTWKLINKLQTLWQIPYRNWWQIDAEHMMEELMRKWWRMLTKTEPKRSQIEDNVKKKLQKTMPSFDIPNGPTPDPRHRTLLVAVFGSRR